MRYNDQMKSDGKFLLIFMILGIIVIIVFLFPVNHWWIFGPDNVPELLQNVTLITFLLEMYPAFIGLLIAGTFLIFIWRIVN